MYLETEVEEISDSASQQTIGRGVVIGSAPAKFKKTYQIIISLSDGNVIPLAKIDSKYSKIASMGEALAKFLNVPFEKETG